MPDKNYSSQNHKKGCGKDCIRCWKNKLKHKNELVSYFFPSLDSNDKYILSYEKIIKEDKQAFNEILDKHWIKSDFTIIKIVGA